MVGIPSDRGSPQASIGEEPILFAAFLCLFRPWSASDRRDRLLRSKGSTDIWFRPVRDRRLWARAGG